MKGVDGISLLTVGYNFEYAQFHKPLETEWVEDSTEKIDWLLSGCEHAMQKIAGEVRQVTEVLKSGELANKTQWGIRMFEQLLFSLRARKLHHGLLLAHAYVRGYKFYFDDSLDRTMPEQGHRGHGNYSQTQVVQDVLTMLREIFVKMNAWDIEEQVGQVPP